MQRNNILYPGILLSFLALITAASESPAPITKNRSLPLVINTWEFTQANTAAWFVLNQQPGGNALDAIIEGCATCERLQCDGTVGYGGSPDENGETTLDAMVMDGSNMNIGAVAGLKQIKDAISVARHVLEHTKHTLLVGDAASNFAEKMGFRRETLATNNSMDIWKTWRQNRCQPNYWLNVYPDPTKNCGPYKPISFDVLDNDNRFKYQIGRWNHDTIGMVVIDRNGQIYAGTSTNGAKHKIPGRVGDSPIPGAGAYADNEIGAAVATGDGDIMMRFLPALVAVEGLRAGRTPTAAAETAMQRIKRYYPDFSGGLVVVDRFGNYGAACVGYYWLPKQAELIDIAPILFSKADDYFAVLNKHNSSYLLSNLKLNLENLLDGEQFFSNLKRLTIEGEHCFATQAISNNGLTKVYCISKEIDSQFPIYEKFVIPGNGVQELLQVNKDTIATLLTDTVEIWTTHPSLNLKQSLFISKSMKMASTMFNNNTFLAIQCEKQANSLHGGRLEIYSSTNSTNFGHLQTLDCSDVIQISFEKVTRTGDLLLFTLRRNIDASLTIYQYKGVTGFQQIVGATTLPAIHAYQLLHLENAHKEIIALTTSEGLLFVEIVLRKF